MSLPQGLRVSTSHEWVRVEGGVATIGITDHAADELQDVVFLELPEVGTAFAQGDACGEVESVKAVSELYAPVSGEVIEVNEELPDALDRITESPYTEGWMMRIRLSDPGELDALMDAGQYATYLAAEGH